MAIHGFPGGVISATAPTISPSGASGVWSLDDQLQAGANWPVAPAFLSNSVRFRSSASAYLTRTPATSTNRRTWTWSGWVKRGALGSNQFIFEANLNAGSDSDHLDIRFTSGDKILFYADVSGSQGMNLTTTQVFRDPSAWYHIVVFLDTPQATASNRARIYVNGSQITAFDTAAYPSQNAELYVNGTINHRIANYQPNNLPFDGYLTEINFIDGQALTPSSFGQFDGNTSVWQPIQYRGSYGINGFYLPFTDNSALTTSSNVGLGKDFSGNSNFYATNNISITAGSTYDSMTDVPTLTSATTANFSTLNPLSSTFATTFSNANLNILFTNGGNSSTAGSTVAVSSGKWYAEMTVTATAAGSRTYPLFGICNPKTFGNHFLGGASDEYSYSCDGFKTNNGTATSVGTTFTTNDVMMMAFDATSGTLWWGKNGTWIASGNPSTGSNPMYSSIPSSTYIMAICGYNNASAAINFGQRPFTYTPPTGFVALNTFNLPTPSIGATASTQANKYMDISLYTGANASQTITGLNFAPNFVWTKSRANAYNHDLYNIVTGVNKRLQTNNTNAESGSSDTLTAFNSNGFTLGANDNSNFMGSSVAWSWAGGGTGVSNTAGSITSTVSANTSAGFSVVTYTGNGSAGATVGHGLGVAPKMVIYKGRTSTFDWLTYHAGLPSAAFFLTLNTTNAQSSNNDIFNSTAPSSTVLTLGGTVGLNQSGGTMVAYCFSEVAGYSKIGSYTGNGSTDGPFLYLGFRPAFILVKSTTEVDSWRMYDKSRLGYNPNNYVLYPNLSNAEGASTDHFDLISNGAKIRSNNNNTSGQTYIYMAFAESPFKYANAR